jgi:hypothetical protein
VEEAGLIHGGVVSEKLETISGEDMKTTRFYNEQEGKESRDGVV